MDSDDLSRDVVFVDELFGLASQRRGHAGTLGALTAAVGIAAALTSGIAAPAALAETDGSSPSSDRSVNNRSAEPSTDTGTRADSPASRGRTGPLSPAAAASRRALPKPASASVRPTANDIPKVASAVTPAEPDIAAPAALPAVSPVVPRIEAAVAEPAPAASETISAAASLGPKQPAPAAALAHSIQPAAAARVVSPPIATVPMAAAATTNLLSSLLSALKGGAPTVPTDAATALMFGVARRETTAQPAGTPAATTKSASTSLTTTAVEAEAMTRSGSTSVVSDGNASGGYAVALRGSASVSTTMTLPDSAVLTFRVRASGGAPNMKLSIDGVPYTTLMVTPTSYGAYAFTGGIGAGTHTVTISSTTATKKAALYVDKVSVGSGPIVESFTGNSGSAPSSLWTARTGSGFDAGTETYSASNAVLDGQGNLVIKATRGSNNVYNSGWVWTKNNLTFGYGTVTARVKVPKGQGLWPSIWMMGADSDSIGWPASGEIDIAELPSTTTTVYSTLHGPISGTSATQQAQIVSNLPDLSTDFHNYWVTHLPNKITFGVDDQTLGTLTPADLSAGEQWVYNRPMYFIMNLSVGGPWAGAPDSSTPSQANMVVDSVTFAGV